MAPAHCSRNRLREYRTLLGVTQAALAERAGISRSAVTAIEAERLVPSVDAALSLAKALGTTVELLFGRGEKAVGVPGWALEPRSTGGAYWEAEVNGRTWRYPAEPSPMLTPLPDGIARDASVVEATSPAPALSPGGQGALGRQTLVVACCDPAAGLLATTFAQATRFRMLILHRSSRQALELLQQGKVHAAGMHLATEDAPQRNLDLVRETLGSDYHLLRIARWQEGVAVATSSRLKSLQHLARSKLRWVGREPGSGAQQCLDRLLGDRPAPRRLARDHHGVAEAVRAGWADAGVCVRLTSVEAGLDFLPVQEEDYELCISHGLVDDPRIQALLQVVRSVDYRQLLGNLPGYNSTDTGVLTKVD